MAIFPKEVLRRKAACSDDVLLSSRRDNKNETYPCGAFLFICYNKKEDDSKGMNFMKKILRICGVIMVLIAVCFVIFALCHPEMSFPWDNAVTYTIYGIYVAVTAFLLLAPTKKK